MQPARAIRAEIVTIGTELTLGQLTDTNAAAISRALAETGLATAWHTTVGDETDHIEAAIETALGRAPVVITTGGIGPTEDDLTREAAGRVLGRELVFHADLWEHIQGLFRRAGWPMAPSNRRQAYAPQDALIIPNPRGTAPAFAVEREEGLLFCLPGVPAETLPLITEAVLPLIREKFHLTGQVIQSRVIKTWGLGESNVDQALKKLMREVKNPYIGLQASQGETKIRLNATAASREEAEALIAMTEREVMRLVGEFVFGFDDDTLPGVTAAALTERGVCLGVIDGFTQGRFVSELSRNGADFLAGCFVTDRCCPAPSAAFGVIEALGADLILTLTPENGNQSMRFLLEGPSGSMERTWSMAGPGRLRQERAVGASLFALLRHLRGAA